MKKLLSVLAIMVVAATTSFAQIGVRIGMDFDKLNSDWKDYTKSNIGLHLGAVYNFELADALTLQPGVYYVQKNWEVKNWDAKVHTHYLEVPVLVKYNIELTSDISIDPHVGPYFGFGFAGKVKDSDMKVFRKKNNGMNLNQLEMGIQFGVGATIFDAAYVGFDYELSFRDLEPFHYDQTLFHGGTAHNSMFMITFGVWIPE